MDKQVEAKIVLGIQIQASYHWVAMILSPPTPPHPQPIERLPTLDAKMVKPRILVKRFPNEVFVIWMNNRDILRIAATKFSSLTQ